MISPELMKRLEYAKYIYLNGCELLDQKLYLSSGMATLNFHDSTEILLIVIAEHVHARIKENTSFQQLISTIEAVDKEANKIPLRSFLTQLNKSRVNFKHYGLRPETDDALKFKRDLEKFFRKTSKQFFNIDYKDISLISLIKKRRVQNYLRKAESELKNNNFQKCIENSAIAFRLIFTSEFTYSPYGYEKPLLHDHRAKIKDPDLRRFFNSIWQKLGYHEEQINVLKYGINLSDYLRFKLISPDIHLNVLNEVVSISLHSKYPGTSIDVHNNENSQFCLKFVIDSALCVQMNRILGFIFQMEKLPKYKVIKNTKVIVTPKNNEYEKEEICEVNEGEILTGYFPSYNSNDYISVLFDENVYFIPKDSVEVIKKNGAMATE